MCKLDGNLMDADVSGKTPPQLIGTLNFPSIWLAKEAKSPSRNVTSIMRMVMIVLPNNILTDFYLKKDKT